MTPFGFIPTMKIGHGIENIAPFWGQQVETEI